MGPVEDYVEDLLGLWLGKFDLIVIDEAHKGRDEADPQGTALVRSDKGPGVLNRQRSLSNQHWDAGFA